MSRTKRKLNPVIPAPQDITKQRIYHAAGYARLSVEDGGKPGADTLEVQQRLISDFIAEQSDMQFCGLFSDNGKTGTNFERPSFERLMREVRTGRVDCIVVKDLSRLGRNYLETGEYLERVFPFLGVRFIAINDSFDTLTAERGSDGYIVPLKNIINDAYSKDISRKITPAMSAMQQRGEFIGSWAAYGYHRCADDPHRIEPDAETAPVVRRIFAWRKGGVSYQKIARMLNELLIPSPSRYLYMNGLAKTEKFANTLWTCTAVKQLLRKGVYLGNMEQGQRRSALSEGLKKDRYLPKKEWTIVRGTHEALIDEETFAAVQSMAQEQKRAYHDKLGKYDNLGTTQNILHGLVFCADCGRPLVRYKSVTGKGKYRWYTWICPTHYGDPAACPRKNFHDEQLIAVIWETLRREIALAMDMKASVKASGKPHVMSEREQVLMKEETSAKGALDKARTLYESLYTSYVDQLLTEQEYIEMKNGYRNEIKRTENRLESVRQQLEELRRATVNNSWVESFVSFCNATELTEEMAHALIERVELEGKNGVSITLRYRNEYRALLLAMSEASPA